MTPSGKDRIPLGSGVITSLLGSGGMASVYEIWNSQLEIHRAVKLLHANCNREALERFQTEIKITAKFHHPNIIEIHAVGQWNGLPFIEMEKADGITLEELIKIRGALPVGVCAAIGLMVAKALEYAHNHEYMLYNKQYHGVIHRDLKPGNIMICKDGTVKLMDFGIARPTDASFHTIDGTVVGTLQYLSSEQLNGENLDVRTDIYSFGVCLYEMLCGIPAFPERNISRLLTDKSKNHYRPLQTFDLKIPHKFSFLVQKCMNPDRKRRIPDATTLVSELTSIHKKIKNEKSETTVAEFLNSSRKGGRFLPGEHTRGKEIVFPAVLTVICFFMLATVIAVLHDAKEKIEAERRLPPPVKIINGELVLIKAPIPKPAPITVVDTAETVKSISGVEITPDEKKRRIHEYQDMKNHTVSTKPVKTVEKASLRNEISQSLKERYAEIDLVDIMETALIQKKYSDVLKAYNELPAGRAAEIRPIIFKARALKLSQSRDYARFLNSVKTDEAEILLEKARLAASKLDATNAEDILKKAEKASRELISYEDLTREIYFLKASCSTIEFDSDPTEYRWKAALEAWYLVKREMRTEMNHEYYRKAESEIARIGEKFRQMKGAK